MGGHVRACEHCDHHEISYNSCRNRHCPKCQARARAKLAQTTSGPELLPISYFHVVFTLPSEVLQPTGSLQNKRLLYGMLFEAASQTLMEVVANPRHLGCGSNRAPGRCFILGARTSGAPSPSALRGQRWRALAGWGPLDRLRGSIALLARCEFSAASFATSFGPCLQRAFQRGELTFLGELQLLADPNAFRCFLTAATNREWVGLRQAAVWRSHLRTEVPGPLHASRWRSPTAGCLPTAMQLRDFSLQGYMPSKTGNGTMSLPATEFIRRFLLHVLPDGFMRIRHYGYLANRHRQQKLATCRRLLGAATPSDSGG